MVPRQCIWDLVHPLRPFNKQPIGTTLLAAHTGDTHWGNRTYPLPLLGSDSERLCFSSTPFIPLSGARYDPKSPAPKFFGKAAEFEWGTGVGEGGRSILKAATETATARTQPLDGLQ